MRKIKLAVVSLSFAAVAQNAHAALVFSNWIGASGGNWSIAANWDPAVAPSNGAGGNTYHVFIDNGNAADKVVILNLSRTIDALTISAGDTLTMGNGIDLEFAVGPIVNDGIISMNSTGASTELEIAASMSLTGSGVVLMGNHSQNLIDNDDSAAAPVLTHGRNHTIRGAGAIIDISLINDGLIDANLATTFTINLVGTTNTNTGTIQSSASGTLNITGTILDNAGGVIQAMNTSAINLSSSSIFGGLLHADAGSSISGTSTLLQNITLTGLLRMDNSEELVYEGTITNNGTISLNATTANTEIEIHANGVTLTGTGEVVMSNDTQNLIDDNDDGGAANHLVHGPNHTIRGAGAFVDISMDNQGLVNANLSTPLLIDLVESSNTNAGTLQSSESGTLNITGTILNNTGGIIQALDTSTVNFATSSIVGGVLHSEAGSALSGTTTTLQDITLTGLLRQDNAEDLTYRGTIINNGTIALNSTGTNTEIAIPPDGTTFAGTGEIILGNAAQNLIDDTDDSGAANVLINGPDHTIRGAGNIGANALAITNQGSIIADGTVSMTIDPADFFNNEGLLAVTGTGALALGTGPFTNTGQVTIDETRTLTRTGNYVQTSGTTTVNGTLALIAAGTLNLQGGILNGTGNITGPVNNSGGSVEPGNSAGTLTVTGAYTQGHAGKFRVEIGGLTPGTQHDRLTVTGTAALAGVIEIALIDKYRPSVGDTFTVLTAGTLNTQFRAVVAPAGIGVTYQGNAVIVKVIATPCAADVTFDSLVNVNDLLAVINGWGACTNSPCPPSCTADVTNDCIVNVNDLLAVINAWGACP